jgi:hypothetical protein
MRRFRALAAFIGCIAILAGAFASVASATIVIGPPSAEHDMAGMSCNHCVDCDKAPCPLSATDCLQMQSNAAPAVLADSVEWPAGAFVTIHWSPGVTRLSGLSSPPDPFPPRV